MNTPNDFYAQVLSKIERGHGLDRSDVAAFLERSFVTKARLEELFAAIEPELYRYPAIDRESFKRQLDDALAGRPG